MSHKILVIGAAGQLGLELTTTLRSVYGRNNVTASDIRPLEGILKEGPTTYLDCTNAKKTLEILKKYHIDTIYNLASLLSASSEQYPQKAFETNLIGLYNTLEAARQQKCTVFTPSSIGVFGENTPKENTPQDTITRPNTMYGVTKLSGELLCDYYHKRYGLDTRGIRFPGIISHKTRPKGGTTDFAVEIFMEAIKHKSYTSYIKPHTYLDMVYIPDAVHAAIQLMESDASRLIHRNAFNVSAMSVDVEMLAKEIRKYIPDFSLTYNINSIKQDIADSWPNNLDDSEARAQWGWNPKYTFKKMVKDMCEKLSLTNNENK